MSLIVDLPLNNLSFGNVSYNVLRELYRKKIKICLFTKSEMELSAFDKIDKEFEKWIKNSFEYRYHNLNKDFPTLNLWHINGAEKRISKKQHLLSFYELDSPTYVEKQIVDMQDSVFLSNPEAVKIFNEMGCDNVKFVPMGFDEDFHIFENNKKIVEGKTHFTLMGKFEKRKHTKEIVQAWIKKYGNNNKYLLSCCVVNPFIKHQQMNALLSDILDGKHYSNVNFLPHLKTNSEVNHLLNSSDIDLTGLSGAEGWNLPSFNTTALGKWSIVYNHTAHTAWATESNSILLQPEEKEKAADGLFFADSGNFNIGNIRGFNQDRVIAAMEQAETKVGTVNEEGIKLQKDFPYSKTVDQILTQIGL
jgi:hypothetical protein